MIIIVQLCLLCILVIHFCYKLIEILIDYKLIWIFILSFTMDFYIYNNQKMSHIFNIFMTLFKNLLL